MGNECKHNLNAQHQISYIFSQLCNPEKAYLVRIIEKRSKCDTLKCKYLGAGSYGRCIVARVCYRNILSDALYE